MGDDCIYICICYTNVTYNVYVYAICLVILIFRFYSIVERARSFMYKNSMKLVKPLLTLLNIF
jgi:hypothetical protein